MSFNLFGFDFLPKDNLFGVWFCSINNYKNLHRSLFTIYYMDSDIILELFYVRLITTTIKF